MTGPTPIQVGDEVSVYCQYCPWSGSDKFMVARSLFAGTQMPRIGKSDGWMDGTVVEAAETNPLHKLLPRQPTVDGPWVKVAFSDKVWVDSLGKVLDEKSLFQWVSVASGSVVRRAEKPEVGLSVLCVRWGGAVAIDEKRFDFAVSDSLIQDCLQAVHNKWKKGLEIHTVYVGSSHELSRVNEVWAAETLRAGQAKAAFYFLWGSNLDAKPGYVLSQDLLSLMTRMESVGIVTRYPNHSSLYELITSKDYQPMLCTNRALCIPPTVSMVASLFHSSPVRAVKNALRALRSLSTEGGEIEEFSGVVKVGNEWMGDGVRAFVGESDCKCKCQTMVDGAHGAPSVLLLQQRVPNVLCEPRVFVFNGKVRGIRYTWNEKFDARTGRIHALRTCPQSRAAKELFGGDICAQKFVERRLAELVHEWNKWLIAAGGEVPVFVRMDFLVSKTEGKDMGKEDGWAFCNTDDLAEKILPDYPVKPEADDEVYARKFNVWTCELGEIGSSMVGFREGRDMLFEAIAESTRDLPVSDESATVATPIVQTQKRPARAAPSL